MMQPKSVLKLREASQAWETTRAEELGEDIWESLRAVERENSALSRALAGLKSRLRSAKAACRELAGDS